MKVMCDVCKYWKEHTEFTIGRNGKGNSDWVCRDCDEETEAVLADERLLRVS